MSEQYAAGNPRQQSKEEDDLVQAAMREFAQLRQVRDQGFAGQWDEVAQLILPSHRNTFNFGNFNSPGEKKTDKQVDATGMLALSRFSAICDSLLTPRNMRWHKLRANDPYIMKDRDVRLWFEEVESILFQYRYAPHANFVSQNQQCFQSLGAFGTAAMFVDEFDGTLYNNTRGIRYKALPLGEVFLRENHQGIVNGMVRWFRMTAEQVYSVPAWKDSFPEVMKTALEQKSQNLFNFIHRICPRTDYDPGRLDYRGKPFTSQYISLEGKCLMSQGGYTTFPIPCSRYDQAPGETYGRSPAMMVLPALKTLNAEKTTFLKQGHRAADPVLLLADDGLVGLNLRPGALNFGGVNADGRPMVTTLPTGDIQISKEMMAEEKALINDAFLVSLFQILTETPTMTATEVIERTNEKGILLAPTVGRQQSEYLGPLIDRELDLLASQGLLPPMPGLLLEAGGSYEVVYTSPLAKAMRAQEAGGFYRTVEFIKEVVNITQDASMLDTLDFDTAIPEIADINGVPVSWMASDGMISQRRRARAQQQAAQQQIQAMPAQAAMMKAQAAAQEKGAA